MFFLRNRTLSGNSRVFVQPASPAVEVTEADSDDEAEGSGATTVDRLRRARLRSEAKERRFEQSIEHLLTTAQSSEMRSKYDRPALVAAYQELVDELANEVLLELMRRHHDNVRRLYHALARRRYLDPTCSMPRQSTEFDHLIPEIIELVVRTKKKKKKKKKN